LSAITPLGVNAYIHGNGGAIADSDGKVLEIPS
jgi:hypothetical protein